MRLRERVLNALAVLSTAVALTATLLAIKSDRAVRRPDRPVIWRDWRSIAQTGAQFGPQSAPVVITVFSDFQCPFCKRFAESVRQTMRQRPGMVRVVFRHYPIEHLHSAALAAAKSSICADRQDRFEAMHDHLFAQQDSLGRKPWTMIALAAGVDDTTLFANCLTDVRLSEIIERDRAAGNQLGMKGTPTVLVNDVLIRWTPSAALLDSLVASKLHPQDPSR